jgi:hypothetical protein
LLQSISEIIQIVIKMASISDRVLDLLHVRYAKAGQKGCTLVHIGCGPGAPLLVRAAERAGTSFQGVGFDSCPLDATRAALAEQRLTDKIVVRRARALQGRGRGGGSGADDLAALFALPEVRSATVLCLGCVDGDDDGGGDGDGEGDGDGGGTATAAGATAAELLAVDSMRACVERLLTDPEAAPDLQWIATVGKGKGCHFDGWSLSPLGQPLPDDGTVRIYGRPLADPPQNTPQLASPPSVTESETTGKEGGAAGSGGERKGGEGDGGVDDGDGSGEGDGGGAEAGQPCVPAAATATIATTAQPESRALLVARAKEECGELFVEHFMDADTDPSTEG